MGVVVGHIRKFDSRLQIELLRAYRPAQFKTPGQAPININTGNNVLVLTEENRAKLIEARQRNLALMPKTREEQEAATVTQCDASTPST